MHKAADRIRNVALVGHRGSGKTSLHEALLFQAGVINRLGTVIDGTTVSDSDPDEKARQMSISLALSSFEWQERKVNLLDTPGDASFVADALGGRRAGSLDDSAGGFAESTRAALAAYVSARTREPSAAADLSRVRPLRRTMAPMARRARRRAGRQMGRHLRTLRKISSHRQQTRRHRP